ncbi:ArsR/SmtB family transcription factor [Pseudonocardia bannensis]|uniref:Winged helix-turn-helix transcriptional regulator n=1 Tax=Pseudonocardia bannensis TaxID=630973 RepID=A0A848DJ16_9PSEU|nr:metalloregulator ArsR/SmtB family transcription factor [Pseudonocardia bannensis]NMH92690.1 winged helix-turn-helix transcriptional regulator [Pseudonocardia bannensis]
MATNASAVLEALGDPTRRLMLERLAVSPCAVGELAAAMPISRPAVSQHLRVLKDAGLVRDEARGTRRYYAVAPEGVEALRRYVERLWTTALSSYADVAEAASTEEEEST